MQDESVNHNGHGKAGQQQVKQDAKEAAREVTNSAKEKTEEGTEKSAHQLDSISEAIDVAALKLDEESKQGLASYAFRASEGIAHLTENL